MEKSRKEKGLIMFTLLTLLLVIIGATYAYFAAQKGTGGSANIEVGAGTTDSLTFNNDDGNLTIVANQDNFGKSNESITEKATVKAKLVPNNNTNTAHETYNIFLIVENNDLIYTKNSDTPELLLKITNPENGEYKEEVVGLKYYDNVLDKESNSYQGYDITTSSNQVYKIVSDYPIDAETSDTVEQTWQIDATLVNLDQDQNKNTGKTFEGSIYITTEDDFELSEINTLKTTVTASSIEATANITSGTSKIANYYFAIEKTNETPEDIKLSSITNALEKEYSEEISNTHTFSDNIVENQNYKIYTYAIDEQGYKSNIYETVVTAKDGELPEVGEYNTSVTPSSITITYPNNEVLNYHVKIDGGKWTDYDKTTNTITGLKENTTYKILIQAKNEEGIVSNIKTVKVTTGEVQIKNLNEFVVSKVGQPVGDGTEALLHHTTDLPNSAGDDSYRYSGNNPYNFVCFGEGSEDYNKGGTTCPDTNLYRMIGVFNNQVKLIKSEYVTSDELGISKDGTPGNGNYDLFKRVKKIASDGFYWNKTNDNTWENSTLKEVLNNNYLNKLGENWIAKIATTMWHVGGYNSSNVASNEMYNGELNSVPTVSAQIGLMYVSDYGFASLSSNWSVPIDYYNKDENIQNNWLFNNIREWTIQRNSSNSWDTFNIDINGNVTSSTTNANFSEHGIRPTFYLKSDVQVKDDGAIGNASNPFRIVV